ncbi:MAG: hypothetical protein P4L31_07030 [Candidatus Babeliales bacterium]|nr:hypothetical protein [Candidatus Babeliales bacterium]
MKTKNKFILLLLIMKIGSAYSNPVISRLKDFVTVGKATQMAGKVVALAGTVFIAHHEKHYHNAAHDVNQAQKNDDFLKSSSVNIEENKAKMAHHYKYAYFTQLHAFALKVRKNLQQESKK